MGAKSKSSKQGGYSSLVVALLLANGISILLFLLRMVDSGSTRYWFLIWNLILAWLPVGFAIILLGRLKNRRWSDPVCILLSVLWLAFLPNSFYLVSDLIHLQTTAEVSVLYDAVLFTSFIFNGFLAGFISLYLLHNELLKRLKVTSVNLIIASVLLACSFAIYLGRVLRWNTWDIILHPTGIIFDVSEQVVNDAAKSNALVTTLSFFLLIGGMYIAIWQFARTVKRG